MATNESAQSEREIAELRQRVAQLESDVRHCRMLNQRIAALADVMMEVLIPAQQRDEKRLRQLLTEYEKAL